MPTRIFHWLVVSSLIMSFCVVYIKLPVAIHLASGGALAWLFAGRVVWGFIGSRYVLFQRFFLKDSFEIGHTKLGWIAYLIMTLLITLTIASGIYLLALKSKYLLATKEIVEFATTLHEIPSNALLFVIIIHLDGVLLHIVMHKQNIIKAMISGKKYLATGDSINKLAMSQIIFAYFWIVGSVIVFGLIYKATQHLKLDNSALC